VGACSGISGDERPEFARMPAEVKDLRKCRVAIMI
jgi:hypothetical protein